jgi:hypothetical protein
MRPGRTIQHFPLRHLRIPLPIPLPLSLSRTRAAQRPADPGPRGRRLDLSAIRARITQTSDPAVSRTPLGPGSALRLSGKGWRGLTHSPWIPGLRFACPGKGGGGSRTPPGSRIAFGVRERGRARRLSGKGETVVPACAGSLLRDAFHERSRATQEGTAFIQAAARPGMGSGRLDRSPGSTRPAPARPPPPRAAARPPAPRGPARAPRPPHPLQSPTDTRSRRSRSSPAPR